MDLRGLVLKFLKIGIKDNVQNEICTSAFQS